MKYLKIILVLGSVFILKSCLGDCYDRLTLIQENSTRVLIKDSSAIFSNDDFEMILNECVTDCSNDKNDKDKRFIFINTTITPYKDIMLKRENFLLTDSLNNIYQASQMRIEESNYDSLMLIEGNMYRIEIVFISDYESYEYFYAPFKMNFAYKLFDNDTLKYFLKDSFWGIKRWAVIAEEWSREKNN